MICVMSRTSRMPFYLWRNVVSLFFLNLKVSRLSFLLGIFKVNFVFTSDQEVCVVNVGMQKEKIAKKILRHLRVGEFCEIKKAYFFRYAFLVQS